MGGAPRLHAIEAVVTLGEDEGQPHDRRLAETQSLPITIGREVFVQEFSHAHVLEVHKDGWYVVDAFVGCCNCCAHPTSLTQISFSRENSHEMSVLYCHFQNYPTWFQNYLSLVPTVNGCIRNGKRNLRIFAGSER